jgi:hypothetical protein
VKSSSSGREFTAELAESAESLLEESFCVFRAFRSLDDSPHA